MMYTLILCWSFYHQSKLPLLLSIDINECELGGDDCHMYATCTDTFGSFECTCNSGFEGDGINCTSMYMSLKIFCAKLNWLSVCTVICIAIIQTLFSFFSDINECELSSLNDCDGNADCIDTIGSYNCSCISGYEGDGFNCTGYTIVWSTLHSQ